MVLDLYDPVGQLSVIGASCVYTIESAMGAQQGDVKKPFLFVNAIHQQFVKELASILSPYEGSFVQFIIDDGSFLLSDEAVLEALSSPWSTALLLAFTSTLAKRSFLWASMVPMMPLIRSSSSSRILLVLID